ncbi:SRPBCC family protein [Paenibacillus sepulcri]|uniref:SRPBCC family protein n=1 Tax=Paenibacillus sepulcri TaxID=359917 RepID=A0ABS7CBZ3_9BACL|nr:SRPBCC family protein [Paenibacillus sepulcri]
MVTVQTQIAIQAPITQCFDSARDISLHTRTVWKHTKEEAVGGVTSGPIGAHQTVTFRATHFGIRQSLTSKITEFNAPFRFVDEMQRGAFKYLKHIHTFEEHGGITMMKDTLYFETPLGWVGRIAERAVLKRYMEKFLEHRNRELKRILEAGAGTIL